jgi:hypothetical protein
LLIKDVELLDGKKIKIEISIYKIAQKLNLIWGGKAKQMIEELIKDIKDVAIYRKMDKRLESYQILDKIIFDEQTKKWSIIYSEDYTRILKIELFVNHSKIFQQMLTIEGAGSGIIKSVINFFITHKTNSENTKIQISLKKLFETIGIPKTQYRKAKFYIKERKDILVQYNISLSQDEKNLIFLGLESVDFI